MTKPFDFDRKYRVRLSRLIKNRFRSQKAFATAVGIQESIVSRILWNEWKPLSEHQIQKWAETLHVQKEEVERILSQ